MAGILLGLAAAAGACSSRVSSPTVSVSPAFSASASASAIAAAPPDASDGAETEGSDDDEGRPPRSGKSKPCAADLEHCPVEGCAQPGSPHALLNTLKRRTTTADGRKISRASAVTVSFDVLRALEREAAALVGEKRDLDEAERSKLAAIAVGAQKVGEGTAARLVGYVAPRGRGRSSGTHAGGIESVNCRLEDEAQRDIHINVMPRPDATECDGVVVEMIPQGRGEHPRWNADELDRLAKDQKLVMIVGPLFYDNEHRVRPDCTIKSSEPKRMSLWEIHPVIEVWVCERNGCTADAPRGWKRFD
jgi:hypothetical protein